MKSTERNETINTVLCNPFFSDTQGVLSMTFSLLDIVRLSLSPCKARPRVLHLACVGEVYVEM